MANYRDAYEKDEYTKTVVDSIKTKKDLWEKCLKNRLPKRHKKIIHIYKNIKLKGHGLELAFGVGTSTYWLVEKYANITLDGIDFNKLLLPLIPILKEINPRIKDFWIGDATSVDKPDGHYDFINSCSFFEHLPDEAYWLVLKECHRILKPSGLLGVWLDVTKVKSHIRLRSLKISKKEIESMGFKAITGYLYQKD